MNQFIKVIWCVLTIFIFFLFSFIFSKEVRADNLLLNSSFEDTTSGVPNSWTKNVSTATLSISSTTKTGTESASINKTNGTTGTIYLYQDVDVEPSSYYSLDGWTVKNDSKFNYSLLRISWRDASVEISKTDSSQLTSDSQTFQELKIDSVQAPGSSIKARIELLANISSPNPTNPVLFDDISFSQVVAPEQPTSTPVVTQTPTSTPTPSPTKTATPTPTPTKTPTPTPTKTLTLSPTPTEESTEMVTFTPSPTPKVKVLGESTKKKENILPYLIIGGGIVCLGFAGYLLYNNRQRENS